MVRFLNENGKSEASVFELVLKKLGRCWKSQNNEACPPFCAWFLCVCVICLMTFITEWHYGIVHVHSRYKFRMVCVYLVSLLEELLEHYRLFWFPPVSASYVPGRGSGFTLCSKDIHFNELFFFFWKDKMMATPDLTTIFTFSRLSFQVPGKQSEWAEEAN